MAGGYGGVGVGSLGHGVGVGKLAGGYGGHGVGVGSLGHGVGVGKLAGGHGLGVGGLGHGLGSHGAGVGYAGPAYAAPSHGLGYGSHGNNKYHSPPTVREYSYLNKGHGAQTGDDYGTSKSTYGYLSRGTGSEAIPRKYNDQYPVEAVAKAYDYDNSGSGLERTSGYSVEKAYDYNSEGAGKNVVAQLYGGKNQ